MFENFIRWQIQGLDINEHFEWLHCIKTFSYLCLKVLNTIVGYVFDIQGYLPLLQQKSPKMFSLGLQIWKNVDYKSETGCIESQESTTLQELGSIGLILFYLIAKVILRKMGYEGKMSLRGSQQSICLTLHAEKF